MRGTVRLTGEFTGFGEEYRLRLGAGSATLTAVVRGEIVCRTVRTGGDDCGLADDVGLGDVAETGLTLSCCC